MEKKILKVNRDLGERLDQFVAKNSELTRSRIKKLCDDGLVLVNDIKAKANKILKVGDVVTVEPGIYIENKFGVRIENMYVITRDGYENLTISDKKLIKL